MKRRALDAKEAGSRMNGLFGNDDDESNYSNFSFGRNQIDNDNYDPCVIHTMNMDIKKLTKTQGQNIHMFKICLHKK